MNPRSHAERFLALKECLITEMYGSDSDWLDENGQFIGLPRPEESDEGERGLFLQRGIHWPPPPIFPPEEQ